MRDGDIRPRWLLMVVAAVAFLAYANNLGNGFVMDDRYNVVQNEQLRSLAHWPRFFTQPWGAHAATAGDRLINQTYWRPLVTASYALDYAIWGLWPSGFHLTNNLIFSLTCALLALLLLQLGLPWTTAGAGALFFAVHPVHTEAVNLISYRTEIMATLWVVLALVIHQRTGPRLRRDLLWLPLLYALGLMSKESAVTLPGWLLLLDLIIGRPAPAVTTSSLPPVVGARAWLVQARSVLNTLGPLLVVFAGYVLVRQQLLRGAVLTFFGDLSPTLTMLSVMKIYLLYLKLLVVPWPLTPFWDWSILPPAVSLGDGEALAGLTAWVATLLLVVLLWRRAPWVCLGLAWWIIGLLPYGHLWPLPVGAAERFLFMPSAGIALVVASLTLWLLRRWPAYHRGVILGGLGLLLVMLAGTFQRNRHWSSDLSLERQACADFPGSFNAHFTLGKLYHEAGQLDQAIGQYTIADRLFPHLPANVERLARALLDRGRQVEARQLLEQTFAAGARTPYLEQLAREARSQYRALTQ
jgi:protein O-mannosyl-transferase